MTIQHEITESDHRHSLRVWPAAVVAFGLVLCSHIIAGLYIKYPPFGSQSASLDDLFRLIIPFLDQFGTILRGTSTSDMLFNWNIGLGANFLPDYATHLAGPWDFLAGIVPMTMTDGLVWIIATLNYSCAAAAMVYLLNAIRPISSQFSRWLIAAMSAGYGLCSWSLSTAYLFLP